ncbi:MAG: TauD/TfdA family dioxygenase [Alphaproteobacteria bacterium]
MAENTWKRSSLPREPAELGKPLVDPALWYPKDILANDEWMYRLSDSEVAEVKAAVAGVVERGLDIKDITKEDFPLPTLAPRLQEVQDELMEGRGIVLIKGLPIDEFNRAQYAAAFWGISVYVGRALSQNRQGHLLGHVKDIGGDYSKTRGYKTSSHMAFHCDQADVLALGCIHNAKAGGEHLVCSAVALYNEMLKRRPDLAVELGWKFYRQLSNEKHPGQKDPYIRQGIFNFHDGYFAVRGVSSALNKGQMIPGVPKFTEAQKEALQMFRDIAPEIAIEVPLDRGDISYVMNHVTLHSRTDFEDWPEPERKRHLLRLWMNTGDRRPLPPEIHKFSQGIYDETTKFVAPLDAE